MTDIHPIAPPPEVGEPLPLWVWGASAALAVLAFVLFRILRRKAVAAPSPSAGVAARTAALDTLHRLKRDYAEIDPAEFAEAAAGALRDLLAQRFGDGSRSLTPEEFFDRHRDDLDRVLDGDRSAELGALLETCDRMRFAPDPDTPSLRLPLAERAIPFVREFPEAQPSPGGAPGPEDHVRPAAA